MPIRLTKANSNLAKDRRVIFDLRQTDGVTPATGEAGGQPQISTNGNAWTNTGISTLTYTNRGGYYYANVDQSVIATAGDWILTSYKSANTLETPGTTLHVVAFDFTDAADLGLSNLDAAISSRSSHSAADVWAVATSGLTSAGTIGKLIVDNLNAAISGIAATILSTPANLLATDGSGRVTVGTNADKTGFELSPAGILAIWHQLLSGIVTASTIGKLIKDYLDAAISSRSTVTTAQVKSEVDTALADVNLDKLLKNAATWGTHVVAGSVVDQMADDGTEVYDRTTDSLQAVSDAVTAATDPLTQAVPGSYAAGTAGAALGKLGAAEITVVSPVDNLYNVTLVKGDDYSASDNRALDFTDTADGWPDLTGATITFVALLRSDGTTTWNSVTASVVTPTGANKQVRIEITAAGSGSLATGEPAYDYQIEATLASGRAVTLVRGELTVIKDIA